MRSAFLAICIGLAPCTLLGASLPEAPSDCAEQVASKGFCASTQVPARGPIRLNFFAVVEASDYPTPDKLLGRYLNFAAWPKYIQATGSNAVIFERSEAMPSYTNSEGKEILPQYYNYRIKTAIGYQKVRGLNLHEFEEAYPGAEKSLHYTMPTTGIQKVPQGENPLNGAEGLKFHSGHVHSVDCASQTRDYCLASQRLLIYEIEASPSIDILPRVAATAMQTAIEAILVGMVAPPDGRLTARPTKKSFPDLDPDED